MVLRAASERVPEVPSDGDRPVSVPSGHPAGGLVTAHRPSGNSLKMSGPQVSDNGLLIYLRASLSCGKMELGMFLF